MEGGSPKYEAVTGSIGRYGIVAGAEPTNRPALSGGTTPKLTYYISQQGDTYLNLALRFYGNTDWKKLMDANSDVSGGATIIPGTKLLLPDL